VKALERHAGSERAGSPEGIVGLVFAGG